MKFRALVIPVVVVLSLIVIFPYVLHPASAHLTKNTGDLSIKVGFANEPPLVGDANTVQVFVNQGSGNNTQPISDTALSDMTITIQYGGKTKTLSFNPSDETPGEYDATVITTQLGSYNIIMKGIIKGQNVDLTFPLTEVEGRDQYYFPPQSGSGAVTTGATVQSAGNNTGSQIGGDVLTQLTRDINDAKDTANSAAESYAKVAQSFQDVKNTTDTLYVVSMVGIGVGGAGVLIAVIALTRKNHL